MKQYFSIDSSIFIFFAFFFIVLGSPIWLMIFSVITIASLIFKAKLYLQGRSESGEKVNVIYLLLLFPLAFGTALFGFFGFGIVLFGFWAYILAKYLAN